MAYSENLNELATALAKAQSEFEAISKSETNPFFKSKYAGLPQVVEAASPIISKHGLSVAQFPSHDEGGDTLMTWLLHTSGQYIYTTMRLHLNKNDAQSQGSAMTYARRYSYMAVLGLVADEDDDGNAASRPPVKAAPATPANPAVEESAFDPDLASEVKRAMFGAKILTEQEKHQFYNLTINKDKPEDDDDLNALLEVLT